MEEFFMRNSTKALFKKLSVLLAAVMILSLSACDNKDETTDGGATNAETTAAETTAAETTTAAPAAVLTHRLQLWQTLKELSFMMV